MQSAYPGVSTYDPYIALQNIEANIVIIAIGLLFAMGLTGFYFFEAIRLGNKHKTFSSPLAATLWFLPHDFSFVVQYDKWFNVYDHWWTQIWWLGLCFTVLIEMYLLYQVVRYGREELMPSASQRQFTLAIIGATFACGVIWWLIKSSLDDELFFTSFFLTIVWPVPFTTAQILRRKSRKGMSIAQELCLIPMMLGLYLALYNIADYFQSPLFAALVAVGCIWAAFNVILLSKQPAYQPRQ